MKQFNLPDVGEGLQEAEIVQWNVQVGDLVEADQIILIIEDLIISYFLKKINFYFKIIAEFVIS